MIRVEKRIGREWAGVLDTDDRAAADDYLTRHAGDTLRLVNEAGDVIAYPGQGSILQPGQAAPLPSSPEGRRLRVGLIEQPDGWLYTLLDGFPVNVTYPTRQEAINAATDSLRELTGRYVQVTLEGAA